MRVIGIGDNVCDKYEHLKMMFPGGQAMNFAVYAKIEFICVNQILRLVLF